MFYTELSLIEKVLEYLNLTPGSSDYKVSSIILSIATVLFIGFLLTRLTKLLKLPNVTAYIVAGLLIGPYCFNVIPEAFISGSEFISDIAVAFISFSAGEYFKLKDLKKGGAKVIIIALFESLLTFSLVFVFFAFVIRLDTLFSLVLGALASATAPTSTLMIIKQTRSKGEYVNTILETIALDNLLAILLFSISLTIFTGSKTSVISFETIAKPILKTLICMGIGIGFGFLLKLLLPKTRTVDNRLIIVIAVILLFCGICALMGESPLLGCMGIGAVYTNLKDDEDKLFGQVNYFIPPIMLIFFVRSGMNFNMSSFFGGGKLGNVSLILISLIYVIFRFVIKYGGAWIGANITKSSKPVRNYIGLGLIPQAGVAVGLVALASREFIACGEVELGNALLTIILASSILYEIIGPICAKLALHLSGSYSTNLDEVVPVNEKPTVETLIKQINEIEKSLPKVEINEDEEAFNEEIENEYAFINNRFMNRRK